MAELIEPVRSLEANARMWAMLTDISRQKQWPVDGEMQWLSKDDWKIIMTAGLKREQRVAKGLYGGFVMLGFSTSKMKRSEMSDLIELIYAWAAEQTPPIEWSDPTIVPLEAYA